MQLRGEECEEGCRDPQESNSLNNNTSQEKVDMPTTEAEAYSGFTKQFIPSNFNMDMKEVSQNMELSLEKPKEKPEKEPEQDIQLPQISHITPTSIETSPLIHVSQNEDNNKENALSSVRIKKFGVVNADAFCDICCKEYCNKYFLRTHKLKSHGILPVDEKKDETVNGTGNNMSWYQMQTTPLNLIVNEASVSKDASEKLGFEVEGEECVCNVCGRYFQSHFLLKMHQAYTHPNKFLPNEALALTKQNTKPFDITKGKDFGDSDLLQKKPIENYLPVVKSEYPKEFEESENKAVVNTESLQKIQTLISRLNSSNNSDSSTCDVCDKDVGHVSLLENHILKEHAVLLEEMGNITEEENSSSQSSLLSPTNSFKKESLTARKHFRNNFY
ncbi:hypothetical protein J6590_051572 [Homalodisca vitripennis]|nr:hypothetical protein J6590_051572 [Homalodisca vitripennis]